MGAAVKVGQWVRAKTGAAADIPAGVRARVSDVSGDGTARVSWLSKDGCIRHTRAVPGDSLEPAPFIGYGATVVVSMEDGSPCPWGPATVGSVDLNGMAEVEWSDPANGRGAIATVPASRLTRVGSV